MCDLTRLNKENFTKDLENVLCHYILNIENENANHSFETFFNTVNQIKDHHIPMKRVSNKDRILSMKPWITNSILVSIRNKNKTRRKICRAKSNKTKNELHKKFKTCHI